MYLCLKRTRITAISDAREVGINTVDRRNKIESQLFQLDTMDKVFLLSDVDEFYDQLEKIFKGNQTDVQGRWVVSNPCFEIWLYYCYLDSPEKVLGCLKTEPITTRSKK